MIDFALTEQNATLENLNTRTEKNGPDKVPAADLKFSTNQAAAILDSFSPTLRDHLFDANGPRDLADGLPIRYPHLSYPLTLDDEVIGATVQVFFGVREPLRFEDCKINRFQITPMDGGTVVVGFRVQCKPDEVQIGKLYLLQEQSCVVTLTPPPLATMPEASE